MAVVAGKGAGDGAGNGYGEESRGLSYALWFVLQKSREMRGDLARERDGGGLDSLCFLPRKVTTTLVFFGKGLGGGPRP